MRKWKHALAAALVVGLFGGLASFLAAREDKPKYTIEEVMEKAHKGKQSLLAKTVSGSASKEEKETLLAMYQALAQNKPPQGDAKSWKTKTDALVSAAKAVIANENGAPMKLKMAANCAACHKVHKGDD
jgi:hypothetical protein